MSGFHFDRKVIDAAHGGIRIDVTRCDAEDEDVQVNIAPRGDDYMYPRITLFLCRKAAAEMGAALLEASKETADADAA